MKSWIEVWRIWQGPNCTNRVKEVPVQQIYGFWPAWQRIVKFIFCWMQFCNAAITHYLLFISSNWKLCEDQQQQIHCTHQENIK